MATLDAAKKILKALGLPPAQQTDIAAYTLLALVNLGPNSRWPDATRRSIRIHDVLEFTNDIFRKRYAENTRETVRRQVIHQFEHSTDRAHPLTTTHARNLSCRNAAAPRLLKWNP